MRKHFELSDILPEQRKYIKAFFEGKDVFVNLTTGFQKSLILQCLSICRGNEQRKSIHGTLCGVQSSKEKVNIPLREVQWVSSTNTRENRTQRRYNSHSNLLNCFWAFLIRNAYSYCSNIRRSPPSVHQ